MAEDTDKAPEADKPKAGKKLCGHSNAHYHPSQGAKVRELKCVLPAGHEGDHQAPYQRLQDGELIDDTAFWSNAVDL